MSYEVDSGAILEITIRGTLAGQTTLTLFHYRLTVLTAQDGLAAIDATNAAFNTALPSSMLGAYTDCQSNQQSIDQIVYQWIYPTRYARVIKTPAILTGAIDAAALPPGSAAAFTKRTDFAGPHSHGTLHLPGAPLQFANEGVWDPAEAATAFLGLIALMNDVLPSSGAGDMTPIIFTRIIPANSQVITSASYMPEIRTMKRRVVGRGI